MESIKAMALAGRCANGAERDHGVRFHALPNGYWKALCGAKPGRQSAGWLTEGAVVTCLKCLKKM